MTSETSVRVVLSTRARVLAIITFGLFGIAFCVSAPALASYEYGALVVLTLAVFSGTATVISP